MDYMGTADQILYIISALGPVIIGLAVAYIAFQQWKTARDRLKLDLYEKRLKVFTAAHEMYMEVMNRYVGLDDGTKLDEFALRYRASQFLFHKKR